jgi:hypothetical protein
MRSFLEQAGAARETATGLRRQMANLPSPEMDSTRKRCDRLDARGAELEYRWLALTGQPEKRLGLWQVLALSWRRRG